jgi:diguanylate cyclase (GGDEF)-like protein
MSDSERSKLLQLVLIPVLFYSGVKLSLAFAVMPEVVVMLWLPNGLLLATLVHYRLRRYVYFALLVIVAEIAADYPTFSIVEAALFGAINLLEVTIAFLLLRYWRFNSSFAAPSDITKFLIAGPGAGAFVTACAAAAIYTYFRGTDTTYLEFLRVWWFSDATGLLIVTPLILSLWSWASEASDEHMALRWFDGVAALLALGIVAILVMSDKGKFQGMHVRLVLLFPFAVYAAARLTPRATTIVIVILAAIVLSITKNGQQPFGELPIHETVFQVQQFVFIMTVTALGLAALLSQLRANARELEVRVHDRTAELRAANEQLQRLAVTDPLTGLLNRRSLVDLMRREMRRHLRHQHELAVIMFDIDRFKHVNDRHGHAAGDIVLRHVASVTAESVRGTDVLARYGGEEFVLVAPETDEAHALQLAERIREALRVRDVSVNSHRLRVTASFGIAMLRASDKEPEHVLARADSALYAAKSGGRDRVVVDTSLPLCT